MPDPIAGRDGAVAGRIPFARHPAVKRLRVKCKRRTSPAITMGRIGRSDSRAVSWNQTGACVTPGYDGKST